MKGITVTVPLADFSFKSFDIFPNGTSRLIDGVVTRRTQSPAVLGDPMFFILKCITTPVVDGSAE